MDIPRNESYKTAPLSAVISLEAMEDSIDSGFLADLPPKDSGALAALERLETPPPTPIFLSELEGSPLSSAGLASPLADTEPLETSGGADQDMLTMDELLNSCGVGCDSAGDGPLLGSAADSPLLSSLDLMWGASPATPAPVTARTASPAPAPAQVQTPAAAETPRTAAGVAGEAQKQQERASQPTPERQLQAEVARLHRQQRREQHTKQLLERQVLHLQRLQQLQDQQHQQLLRQQRQQQRQKQHLHWQQHQLQQRQTKFQQRSQSHQNKQQQSSGAKSTSPPAAPGPSPSLRTPAKVRRKTRVITIPSSSGTAFNSTVTVPHIVICTPNVINSRPAATTLPVTFSVQDRQTAAARVTARPTVTLAPRDPSRPLGLSLGPGVRRRVVGRAAPGSTLVKRHSVESAPSSPEAVPCSLLRIHGRKPVTKVTTATQTGEAVDEVLRNNDSTLIRLLVTGQDLSNGYRLCPDGQCVTPERQPAPPSLFAGLPDRGSSVLLSMLSNDEEPPLPALFPSETAGRLLDDPL